MFAVLKLLCLFCGKKPMSHSVDTTGIFSVGEGEN